MRVSKRALLEGMMGLALVGPVSFTSAAQPFQAQGCIIPAEAFGQDILSSSGASASSGRAYQASSGDLLLDGALAVAVEGISQMFDVSANVVFYDDGGQPNAHATPFVTHGDFLDGTVALGLNLTRRLLRAQSATGAARIAGICAHEFAHIRQFSDGSIHRLWPGGVGSVFHAEMHADIMSGYYAGRRKQERVEFPVQALAEGVFSIGDLRVLSANHHGTPAQRGEAFRRGYLMAIERGWTFDQAHTSAIEAAFEL